MKHLLFTLIVIILSGCSLRSWERDGLRAADGLSGQYPADAALLANETADELSRRYAPAQTALGLLVAPGQFGVSLEHALRGKGFAIQASGEQVSGIRVGAVSDVLRDELIPMGYVEVTASDGQRFSLVRRLKGGNIPAAPEIGAPEAFLANSGQILPTQSHVRSMPLVEPVMANVSEPTKNVTVEPNTAAPRPIPAVASTGTWPVRKTATAKAIARRNNVAVDDFCAWNNMTPGETVPKGASVYLKKPAFSASTPAVATVSTVPVASVPITSAAPPAPVSPATAPLPTPEPVKTPESVNRALAELKPAESDLLLKEVAPLPEEWAVHPGGLQDQLRKWGDRARYQLVWKSTHDFQMESKAIFTGTFLEAIQKLFLGLHKHGIPLRVRLYEENNVFEVIEE